jgi:hypothetical protein
VEGVEGVEEVEGVEGVGVVKENFVRKHQDLAIYKMAFAAAMEIFELSKKFPYEERFSLIDQMRRFLVRHVQIWLRHGAKEDIKQHS